jgi:GntR family transcriptional repressor for pyruvate dehydrogenase complex
LREAIQKLVLKGLLTTRHGGGTHVTDRLEAHFVDPWQDMLKGHPLLHRDLLEFRQMLESQAATLAAQRATDVDISLLDAAYSHLQSVYATTDLAGCIDADVAFHQAVADASHNVLIAHLTSSLMRVIHGHVSTNLAHLQAHPPRWQQLQAQHCAIWQGIRQRQPQQAGQAASAHIEFVRQSIEDNAMESQRRSSALRRLGESG